VEVRSVYKAMVKEGKLIPSQAYGGSGRLRLPDSVTLALEGGRLSGSRTGRIYPQEYPLTHFKRPSRPRARGIVGCHGRNPSDTTGDRSRDLPTSSTLTTTPPQAHIFRKVKVTL
jgi:hypothetical protein